MSLKSCLGAYEFESSENLQFEMKFFPSIAAATIYDSQIPDLNYRDSIPVAPTVAARCDSIFPA